MRNGYVGGTGLTFLAAALEASAVGEATDFLLRTLQRGLKRTQKAISGAFSESCDFYPTNSIP